jgi:demethylmenaquinone methyltransferase/2-methoxy-6-polyprenyl-1,4-benzoquinol methylase
MRFDEYSYGTIARFYDWLAGVYSRGQIAASKRGQLDEIECGDRVLYAGVGTGQDALRAVRAGARVTAIDLAPEMLERFAKQLAREDLDAELVCGDVSVYKPSGLYDVVVANYFLNLFDVEHAREMLRHLCELVKSDGALLLTDFALPQGGPIARAITEIYYRPVNWIAWALGFCALHPILDYARLLEPMGFRVRSERRLPVFLGANPAYVSIVGRRVLSGQRASAPPSA